jgi:hypothetical protein
LSPEVTDAPAELRCEEALARLDVLIAGADVDPDRGSPALTEARALRGGALELMASGDFDIAIDLIESAIALLDREAE